MNKSEDFNQNIDHEYEFFNLGKFLNLISRNKTIVALSSSILFVSACIYSFTVKRTWQGNFQIVIENKNNKQSSLTKQLGDISFVNILGTQGVNNKNFNTEITILKSPLVLMPVFEYVNSQNTGKDSRSQLNSYDFEKWKGENLDIKIIGETQVLQIKYKDTNKSIILPVLRRISAAYQKYSKENNNVDLELLDKYLEKQIQIYSDKARKSIKELQEYAIDQDLSLPSTSKLGAPIIDVELIRTKAANLIRLIDKQIEQIENTSDPELLQYLGSSISILSEEDLNDGIIKEIDQQLLNARLIYNENVPSIKRLIREKNLNIKLAKKKVLGILKAQRAAKLAEIEAAKRPKNVLITYKDLVRKAQSDEATLVNLEIQLSEIKLLKAKENTPWELITQPTFRNIPIAPSRKKIGGLGLLLGFISGLLIALYKEKKSGIIYEADEIEKLSSINVINDEIDFEELNFLNFFLKDLVNKSKDKKISLFLIGEGIENIKSNIISNSESKFIEKNIIFNFDLSSFRSENYNFLIINLGSTRYNDVLIFNKRIEFLKFNFDGIIKVKF